MCGLAGVSRAGFYRAAWETCERQADIDLRDAMQRIALEFPCYGGRRIRAELQRGGWAVNHKRVYRLMRMVLQY
jgi:putative transposase